MTFKPLSLWELVAAAVETRAGMDRAQAGVGQVAGLALLSGA